MNLPQVKSLDYDRFWQLEENYIYETDEGLTVFIPKLFIFDLEEHHFFTTSDKFTEYNTACMIQAWLLATDVVSYECACEIYLEALKSADISTWKRLLLYWLTRSMKCGQCHDSRAKMLLQMQKKELGNCKEHYDYIL